MHEKEFLHLVPFAFAYIDPGAGYVFTSSAPAILGILASFFGSLFFFFRKFIFSFFTKKRAVFIFITLLIAGIIVFVTMQPFQKTDTHRKVVVIGFDGMDPNILQKGWRDGKFPNLKKLKDTGYFSALQTVVPPQSPVAWASFITGSSPSKHKIYDFIIRDPKNYSLSLVFTEGEGAGNIIGQKSLIKTTPFWEITTKHNIPATILYLPDTYEPPKIGGKLISGMGVPDILGTEGTFTLFTTKSYNTQSYTWRGKVIPIQRDDPIQTEIEGPKYVFLKETKIAKIPLSISIDKNKKEATFRVQDQKFTLAEGEFSDWKRLEFKIDFFTKISGIGKFFVKEVSSNIEIYLSPMNFDPESPVNPISEPQSFAKDLVKRNGFFSTLGLPHDTWALEEDVLDEDSFLRQSQSILDERKKIYFEELNRFKGGILLGYFGMTDTIQHMFWRFLKDPNSKYSKIIEDYYGKMDDIVGQTLKKIDKDTILIILSDHGFYSFDYEVNLNTWLKENGYLVLKDGKENGGPLFEDVDWSKTKAYAAGYNGIYLNLEGREESGIVSQKEAQALVKEISGKLLQFKNPQNGESLIKKVYDRKTLGISDDDASSPDLFVGYYKGSRSSWDTAIGVVPADTVRKRDAKWSGDHLFDPTEVPGVLFVNKKLKAKDPRIIDVIPSVLGVFGVGFSKDVDGKDLFSGKD